VISWKVVNAFPTKLTAPTFDAKSNDVAIETLELKADLITMEEG
jgi:phage tail-like protein